MVWVNVCFFVVLYFLLRLAYIMGQSNGQQDKNPLNRKEYETALIIAKDLTKEYQAEILRLKEEVLKLKLSKPYEEVIYDR